MIHFSALIVDDEAIARANLRAALQRHPQWHVAAEAESGEAALVAVRQHQPDVVFLDVEMPGMPGLQAARELSREPGGPQIVFVTAYDRYAVEAFELCAVDYLLKPFDDERLAQTLERLQALAVPPATEPVHEALDYLEHPQRKLQRLLLRSVGSIRILPIEDVLWLASAGNYVEVHHREGTDLHRIQLATLELRLPPGRFLRVHRSAVVRLSAIREIRTLDRGVVAVLEGGHEVRVSARHRDALVAALER